MITINRDPSRQQLNWFGFAWFVVFGGLGIWSIVANGSTSGNILIVVMAVVIPLVGSLFPKVMRWIFVGASYAAFPIGFAISFVMIALVYFLVLTPIGILKRMLGRKGLTTNLDRTMESYWIAVDDDPDLERHFRQY